MQTMCRALIPGRILEQVLLVVIFSRIPVFRGRDLRHDLLALRVEVLRLNLGGDPLGYLTLLWSMIEDCGAVL
jgi:hypothetical protein